MPKYSMPMMADSIASGMAEDTISPARSCNRNTEQDSHDNDATFDQVLHRRVNCPVDQGPTIIERRNTDAWRQAALDPLQPVGNPVRNGAAILSLQQHGDAHDGFTVAVLSCRPLSDLRSDSDLTDRFDEHRRASGGREHDVFDVVLIGDQANAANELLLATAFQVCATDIGIVLCERVHDLMDRQTVRVEPGRIDQHFVLLLFAAKTIDLDDALQLQLGVDVPIKYRSQLTE